MYKSKKRIYVAGPLNAMAVDYIKNLHKMMRNAEDIRRILHCAVYTPGIDFMLGVQFGDWDYADYFDNSQPWLEVSDAVFMAEGWSFSSGCKREHKRAMELGIPICYSLEELRIWLENDGLKINKKEK